MLVTEIGIWHFSFSIYAKGKWKFLMKQKLRTALQNWAQQKHLQINQSDALIIVSMGTLY